MTRPAFRPIAPTTRPFPPEAHAVGEFQDDGNYLQGLLWACVPLAPFWYAVYRTVELVR